MPVCSYLVVPAPGAADSVAERLSALPGCDMARSENRNVLLLVTDTPGPEEDAELRATLERMEGIQALVLSFGEIDAETSQADPLARDERRRRRPLPVVDPSGIVPGVDATQRSSYPDES
jgi:nitrate reductase NapAB chaperone NapD